MMCGRVVVLLIFGKWQICGFDELSPARRDDLLFCKPAPGGLVRSRPKEPLSFINFRDLAIQNFTYLCAEQSDKSFKLLRPFEHLQLLFQRDKSLHLFLVRHPDALRQPHPC
jgi:hypothetical protein